jgi:hypothetical protein
MILAANAEKEKARLRLNKDAAERFIKGSLVIICIAVWHHFLSTFSQKNGDLIAGPGPGSHVKVEAMATWSRVKAEWMMEIITTA